MTPGTFETAFGASPMAFVRMADAMPQIVWSTRPDGYHDFYNSQWYEYTGVPLGSTDGEAWNNMFHPDDQERARKRWAHSLATGEPYEVEYRLRHRDGEYRWTLGRARPIRGKDGTIMRWIGTCTDINDAKRVAEQNEVLSRELSHRIKNIFAVITGLIGLAARTTPSAAGFAHALQGRVAALGRAHEFVRPHSEESVPHNGTVTLHTLLGALLEPYPALESGHLVITGEDVPVDDRGATPIGMVIHELATNAMKYGALSVSDGQVKIVTARSDGNLEISWCESGGPPIPATPARSGFGTRLTELSVVRQLGGRIERRWLPEGLCVDVQVPLAALARPASGEQA